MNQTMVQTANEVTVPIYSALGQKSDLSFSLIRCCVMQLNFPVFLALVVAVLVLFDAHDYVGSIGSGFAILVWSFSILGLAGLYIAILSAFIVMKRYMPRLVVFLPLVGFVAMIINTYITVFHASLYMDEPLSPLEVATHLPFNLAMGLIFETLFFTFVKPVLERNSRRKKQTPENAKRVIQVSGVEIRVSEIILLRAQDHYVDVITDSGKTMIRSRMGDFIAQLSDDEGTSPHRSYWVSWRKIEKVEMTPDYAALTMNDGSVVPIAKSKKSAIENGMKNFSAAKAFS